MRRASALVLIALWGPATGCTTSRDAGDRIERFRVEVRLGDGAPLPAADAPLPIPLTTPQELRFDVRAEALDGSSRTDFDGYVRVSIRPGTVVALDGDGSMGRNVLLRGGQASDVRVSVRGARGATRLWVEDVGYVPGDPFAPPGCADGADDDQDGLVDYPDDPGCAFANDDTETGGNESAGVSPEIWFSLPRLGDVQGRGVATPYLEEGVTVLADAPALLIVTRITTDGFYVSDVTDGGGYGHLFAFNFSTPPGMRLCDRLTRLSGTATEFFGFTELGFPGFGIDPWRSVARSGPCRVPEPAVLDEVALGDPEILERVESGLVRVVSPTIGAFFGPEPAAAADFAATRSNCDLNADGKLDFSTGSAEGACANACAQNPDCVEWSGYVSRGNFRVKVGAGSVQLNTRSIAGFDPPSARGATLGAVTGTLRNFSGGSLNWTIEARCSADLVCNEASQRACAEGPKTPQSSQIACVEPRTEDDPDENL